MKPSEILRGLADLLDAKDQTAVIVSEPVVPSDEQQPPVELETNPVMVPPLQQDIELKKAALGKDSEVIDELVNDDDADFESEDGCHSYDDLAAIRKNAGLSNVMDIISGPLDA